MADWIYLLFIPAMLVIVWFWPERTPSDKAASQSIPANTRRNQNNRYHAVSIQPCAHACSAVLALQGKRFLAAEAISLPLMTCDAEKCTCTYKHHIDRRQGNDRRYDSIVMDNIYARGEHRSGYERRRQHAF